MNEKDSADHSDNAAVIENVHKNNPALTAREFIDHSENAAVVENDHSENAASTDKDSAENMVLGEEIVKKRKISGKDELAKKIIVVKNCSNFTININIENNY